jgi:multiple sugar transport system permease protein
MNRKEEIMQVADSIGNTIPITPRKKKKDWTPFWFLLPSLVILSLVFLLPIGFAFLISFFRFDLLVPGFGFKFVGLDNFIWMVNDQKLLASVRWTFQFTACAVATEMILGMIFALLLNSSFLGKARNVLRAVFLTPIILSGILSAHMVRLMFRDNTGPINHLVTTLGFDRIAWGADALSAQVMILFSNIWLVTPFAMLIFLAGLQNIPDEILEAASIDGANNWFKFIYIIIPYLKFPILLVAIIRTMDALRIFDQIYVLTSGGPGSATSTVMFYNYQYAFSYFQLGRASAISFTFLIIIFSICLVYTRILQREVYD